MNFKAFVTATDFLGIEPAATTPEIPKPLPRIVCSGYASDAYKIIKFWLLQTRAYLFFVTR